MSDRDAEAERELPDATDGCGDVRRETMHVHLCACDDTAIIDSRTLVSPSVPFRTIPNGSREHSVTVPRFPL